MPLSIVISLKIVKEHRVSQRRHRATRRFNQLLIVFIISQVFLDEKFKEYGFIDENLR